MSNPLHSSLYVSAFSQLNEMHYILDKDSFLVDCSERLLRFLGCDVKEITEHSIYDLFQQQGLLTSDQIHSFQEQDINCILYGHKTTVELAIINKNGSVIYLEILRNPLMDKTGHALGLSVLMRDVTALKQLRYELRSLKKQLRYKFESTAINTQEKTTLHPLKILIVEDNQIEQKYEKGVMMSLRCLTDIASTPKQAQEYFQPGKYDLVLMDLSLGLGECNGCHLTTALRRKEQGSSYHVPIIALTGKDLEEVGIYCEDSEMDGFLSKPISAEQAKQLLQRYVHHIPVNVKGLTEFKQ